MGKTLAFALVVVLAIVFCALYGALHDQLSYTLSEEYFTRFKFEMFGVPTDWPPRLGAAFVGACATWWLGPPVGIVLGSVGLFAGTPGAMLREVLRAFCVVAVVAAVVGLLGLAWGALVFRGVQATAPPGWFFPAGLIHPAAFLRVGAMHNASYLGGFLGVVAAAVRLAVRVGRKAPVPAF